jgi:hypothetical protein
VEGHFWLDPSSPLSPFAPSFVGCTNNLHTYGMTFSWKMKNPNGDDISRTLENYNGMTVFYFFLKRQR